MNKIIYDFQLNGHNLEYLHHLYIGASNDVSNTYFMVVPEDFRTESKVLSWPKAENISMIYFNAKDVFMKSDIYTSWQICRQLKKLVKITNADEIFLVWMMNVIPFLPFFISPKVKVSGIIYRIYLYTWKRSSLFTKIQNCIKYYVMTHSKCIDKVYILNDSGCASVLNKIWNTEKFRYLPDPYVGLNTKDVINLREELNVDDNTIICLHPGAMSIRKGTMRIMEMIDRASPKELCPYTFIFAGKIGANIKEEFYRKLEFLQHKAHIIVKDDFLPFDELINLFYTSDCIILPYSMVDMSSGSIAYAAQFSKPVYVPKHGLLSKLVRKYKIGKPVDDFSDISYLRDKIKINSNYCKSHTVEEFNNTIFNL